MQDKIIDALRRNALEEALAHAHDWAANAPGDVLAHRWLAAVLQQRGDHAAAMRSIDTAIALAPLDDSLLLARASLQLAARQMEQAGESLSLARGINPNQLGAYLAQAQLAFGRGDIAEAERLNRLAARVAPDSPQLAVVDGLVALQRGELDAALKRVSAALKRAPGDVQLRYVLGLLYMNKQHWAFAEQAFRSVVEAIPASRTLRSVIADLVTRQGRPAEAADELAPLLADPATATPALQRAAGLLRASAGQPQQALPLLHGALLATPRDPQVLQALVAVWNQLDAAEQARPVLETALASAADVADLWRARLVHAEDDQAAHAVLQRWMQAMPGSMQPWEILLTQQQAVGDLAGADATAAAMLERVPTHVAARLQVLHSLEAANPQAAVSQLEAWLLPAGDPQERRFLQGLLGLSYDQQGQPVQAAATWAQMQQESASLLAPLPVLGTTMQDWAPMPPRSDDAARVAFLWGPPGSSVERLAAVMEALGEPFRSDRFGPAPPQDGFQSWAVIQELGSGRVSGEQVAAGWRAALPSRGLATRDVFDWLPWWDNALLLAMRPHLDEAVLVIAVRDPRDMLLNWLAFGSAASFALPSPEQGARWLATVLEQVATLSERQWFHHRLVRTDHIGNDPQAAAALVSDVLETPVPAPDSVGPDHFPAGHWRHYTQALAGPFAILTPVAQRLGYPEN